MRIVKLSDVPVLEDGEIIPSIRGTIVDVYERKTGSNDKGEWSIQNATISGDGVKVDLKVHNRDDIKPFKGKVVLISCKDGSKGLTGVYALHDTYGGKTTKKVKLTATAVIESGDAPAPSDNDGGEPEDDLNYGMEPASETPAPRPATKPATRPAPAPAPAPAKPASNGNGNGHHNGGGTPGPGGIKVAINRYANTMLACYDAAVYVKAQADNRHAGTVGEVSPEQFQAMVSSLFIQAMKDGQVMPAGSYEKLA